MATVLQRISTAEAVCNHFREAIARGELKPGEALPSERKLQESFGISRFSLREGLARLNALGLIEIRHGRGAFVRREVSPDALEQVLSPLWGNEDPQRQQLVEARQLIEGNLAALAAERHTNAQLDKLDANTEEMAAALNDPKAFCAADLAFHRLIAAAADNPFLQTMHEVLQRQLTPLLEAHNGTRKARRATLKRHQALLACIAARQPEQARTCATGNLAAWLG